MTTIAANPRQLGGDRLTSDRHCILRCGDGWYGVPAVAIREVVVAPRTVRLPESPPWLLGIAHLQSEFVPVISLTDRLGIDAPEASDPRLLVMQGTPLWALSVAEVTAIEPLDAILAPEARGGWSDNSAVMGTAMRGDQMVSLLEPQQIVGQCQDELQRSCGSAGAAPWQTDHDQESQR